MHYLVGLIEMFVFHALDLIKIPSNDFLERHIPNEVLLEINLNNFAVKILNRSLITNFCFRRRLFGHSCSTEHAETYIPLHQRHSRGLELSRE